MAKAKDLTNKRFGRLRVVDRNIDKQKELKSKDYCWDCACDCGNKHIVRTGNLVSGKTKSCGCLLKESIKKKRATDLSGQRFGRLVVIDRNFEKQEKLKSNDPYWNCICDCGKNCIIKTSKLKSDKSKSCGCLSRELTSKKQLKDLSNQEFGYLKVICRNINKKSKTDVFWDCECKCGNKTIVCGSNLKRGKTKSCGCYAKKLASKRLTTHGIFAKCSRGELSWNAYHEYRFSKNPILRVRNNITQCIKSNLKSKYLYVDNGHEPTKKTNTFKNLPYTVQELKEHLELQFEPWMNWENYGSKWHIDHKIPHSCFNYTSLDDPLFLKCWDLRNLQPLEKSKNISKHNKILPEHFYLIDLLGITIDV